MSGIINSTGSKSGVIGTTVGTPVQVVPAGHIVDVQTALYTGESTYAASVDGAAISALSVTMNPADGNDILITCHISCSADSGIRGGFWVSKSGTSFLSGNVGDTNESRHRAAASFGGTGDNVLQQCSFQNLDEDPYTGSSITYTAIADGESTYGVMVNKSYSNGNSPAVYVGMSSITAIEIQR